MKQIILSIVFALFIPLLFAQTIGSAPLVTDVVMEQIGNEVYITYNLEITDNPVPCHVTLVISGDEGQTFNIYASPDYLEGDVGDNVTVGPNKEIIWNINQQAQVLGPQGIDGESTYVARVIARRIDPDPNPDHPDSPAGFIFVQGTIDSGVTFSPGGFEYFNPGWPGAEDYDVSLSDFYIARHEVTQEEYLAVMGTNPSYFTGNLQRPVEMITWFNTIEYCNRRSMQEGLDPAYRYNDGIDYGTDPDDWPEGWNNVLENHINVIPILDQSGYWATNGYRLPTEMEWEYAARGGIPAATATPSTFDDSYAGTCWTGHSDLGDYAWYDYNSGGTTHPVGTKLPNELGLYDMSGNVFNLAWDIYGSYPSGSFTNPTGPVDFNTIRAGRGGCWLSLTYHFQVWNRISLNPHLSYSDYGFRVCRNSP